MKEKDEIGERGILAGLDEGSGLRAQVREKASCERDQCDLP
jgi:hypothetical protein